MYKKITHTIVEEHFDHPLANQIKSSIDRKVGRPTDITFDREQFSDELTNWMATYVSNIQNLINATSGTDDDIIDAFEVIANSDIDKLGMMMRNFYQYEIGERLNANFRMLMTMALLHMQTAKFGKSSTLAKQRAFTIASDIADAIAMASPNIIFTPMRENIVLAIEAIFKKTDAIVSKNIAEQEKQSDIIDASWRDFMATLVNGILEFNPDRFTTQVPSLVSSSSNKRSARSAKFKEIM